MVQPAHKREMLFACAMRIEYLAAQRLGTALFVGVKCRKRVPQEPVISFGFAGALHAGLPLGAVIDITAVVDEEGRELWRGEPLGAQNARQGVVVGVDRFIGSAEERAALCKKTNADIVDMESGILAANGGLVGGVRVVSDTPAHHLGVMSKAFKDDGRPNWFSCARLSLTDIGLVRNGFIARRALYNVSL